MAKIVLGMGTSHAPQLQLLPDQWYLRAKADQNNPELWFNGSTYTFPELVEARSGEHFDKELGSEKAEARHLANQKAIAHLAATLDRVAPDVCIIVGDDQHESFNDDNQPAMSIYWGQTLDDAPVRANAPAGQAFGLMDTPIGNAPGERVTHPGHAELGRLLIESLVEDGFDMAHTNKLPEGRHGGVIGHAMNFVYRRLMNNEVIPNVPIFLNTYYPPNQPTMKRCYALGKSLRKAIEAWDSNDRVAIIASGGLSHFVIEEELDQRIISGLKNNDEEKLTGLPMSHFNSGTSEIRNWVVASGAMAGDGLEFNLVDYVPCYRSEAGTGCAMAFAEWL